MVLTASLGASVGDFVPVFESGISFKIYSPSDPAKPLRDLTELSIDAFYSPLPVKFSIKGEDVGDQRYWTRRTDLPRLGALMIDMASGNWQYEYRTKEMSAAKRVWVMPGPVKATRSQLVKCVTE